MTGAEKWMPILGYEGMYEASDRGRVRALKRLDTIGRPRSAQILKPSTHRSGHKYVVLSKDGGKKIIGVHVLVLLAFVGPRPHKFDACHWNDVPDDNNLTNLRWASRSDNRKDCVRNGHHSEAIKTHCPRGHEYTPENTYVQRGGSRMCRSCKRWRRAAHLDEYRRKDREYRMRRRALINAAAETEKGKA